MYVSDEGGIATAPWREERGKASPVQSLFFANPVMLYQPEVCWADPLSLSTASASKTSFCWDGPLGSSVGSEFKAKAKTGPLTDV